MLFVRPRGWHLEERHFEVDGAPMSGSLFDFGLYFLRNHGRNGRYFYLPKLESHLEARLWNDVFVFAQERLGVAPRDDQGDRPDRDDPRGVRDGRDPPRAARALGRPQRRPLGLHLQRHQEARAPARVRAPRPRRRDDGGAVHAGLLRAPREDVPPPRRARDGRHGGVHPVASRRRGERGRAREGPGGQGSRGVAGLRRDLGRAPRPRPGRDGVVRPRPRRPPEPDRAPARRRRAARGRPAGRRRDAGGRDRGRPPQQRLGRDPVPRRLAARVGCGRDQQPHGGRGDRGDLPIPDLAVAPARPRRRGGRPPDHRGGDREARPGLRRTRARSSSRSRPSPTSSSSSRCRRTTGSSRPRARPRNATTASAVASGSSQRTLCPPGTGMLVEVRQPRHPVRDP